MKKILPILLSLSFLVFRMLGERKKIGFVNPAGGNAQRHTL